jgi:hypothetical protein
LAEKKLQKTRAALFRKFIVNLLRKYLAYSDFLIFQIPMQFTAEVASIFAETRACMLALN